MRIVRHGLALLLLFTGRHFLEEWYLYLHPKSYALFGVFYCAGLLLAAWPQPWSGLRKISHPRLIAASILVCLALPWGEWLRFNIYTAREDWSRQIFHQTLFLYAAILVLRIFPAFRERLYDRILRFIDRLASWRYALWIPCLAFFVLTASIGAYIFQHSPIVEDSAAHLFQAKIFRAGRLFAPEPPSEASFDFQGDMLVIHDGRWFSMYAPGLSLLLALAMPLHVEWYVCPLLGALTLWIWILYVRRWGNRSSAMIFACLFLFSPFLFLMSSTIMVHTPELFVASACIYWLRKEEDAPSRRGAWLLFALLASATIVRGFSMLIFLTPSLAWGAWNAMKMRRYAFHVALVSGILLGVILLGSYQKATTGNFLVPGYWLEYPDLKPGFGKRYVGRIHTPARGLENTSNNILGLNRWLNGWFSGSLFFVCAWVLRTKRFERWDILLAGGCVLIVTFYFFVVAQDLVFGPRYFYILAPVLLLFISNALSSELLACLMAMSLVAFLPLQLFSWIHRYEPYPFLRDALHKIETKKTLLFLDASFDQSAVNWNDPLLRGPWIVCRDLGEQNRRVISAFPDHTPLYFRLGLAMGKAQISGKYQPMSTPNPNPGDVSFFRLALIMQAAEQNSDRDCFDYAYTELFPTPLAVKQLRSLDEKSKERDESPLKGGLLHAARMMLVPETAFLKSPDRWEQSFDAQSFRNDYSLAMQKLQLAGDVGKSLSIQIAKVGRRIDQDSNGVLSDNEIHRYLAEKFAMLVPD